MDKELKETSRLYDLHLLVKYNNGISIERICANLPQHYKMHKRNAQVYKDIIRMNEMFYFDEILIVKDKCVYIASKEESIAYSKKILHKAIAYFNRFNAIKDKFNKDGTMEMLEEERIINSFLEYPEEYK